MEEVEEVTRPHLMDRGEEKVRLARNEPVLDLLGPSRVGRGDIIDRRKILFVRSRDVDVGEVLPVVGRGFLDFGFFRPRHRHYVVRHNKLFQFLELFSGRRDRSTLGLVGVHLAHAVGDGHSRRPTIAGGSKHILVGLQVRLADLLELGQRRRHHLGVVKHLLEFRRPQREVGAGRRPLRLCPISEPLHRRRRSG